MWIVCCKGICSHVGNIITQPPEAHYGTGDTEFQSFFSFILRNICSCKYASAIPPCLIPASLWAGDGSSHGKKEEMTQLPQQLRETSTQFLHGVKGSQWRRVTHLERSLLPVLSEQAQGSSKWERGEN